VTEQLSLFFFTLCTSPFSPAQGPSLLLFSAGSGFHFTRDGSILSWLNEKCVCLPFPSQRCLAHPLWSCYSRRSPFFVLGSAKREVSRSLSQWHKKAELSPVPPHRSRDFHPKRRCAINTSPLSSSSFASPLALPPFPAKRAIFFPPPQNFVTFPIEELPKGLLPVPPFSSLEQRSRISLPLFSFLAFSEEIHMVELDLGIFPPFFPIILPSPSLEMFFIAFVFPIFAMSPHNKK